MAQGKKYDLDLNLVMGKMKEKAPLTLTKEFVHTALNHSISVVLKDGYAIKDKTPEQVDAEHVATVLGTVKLSLRKIIPETTGNLEAGLNTLDTNLSGMAAELKARKESRTSGEIIIDASPDISVQGIATPENIINEANRELTRKLLNSLVQVCKNADNMKEITGLAKIKTGMRASPDKPLSTEEEINDIIKMKLAQFLRLMNKGGIDPSKIPSHEPEGAQYNLIKWVFDTLEPFKIPVAQPLTAQEIAGLNTPVAKPVVGKPAVATETATPNVFETFDTRTPARRGNKNRAVTEEDAEETRPRKKGKSHLIPKLWKGGAAITGTVLLAVAGVLTDRAINRSDAPEEGANKPVAVKPSASSNPDPNKNKKTAPDASKDKGKTAPPQNKQQPKKEAPKEAPKNEMPNEAAKAPAKNEEKKNAGIKLWELTEPQLQAIVERHILPHLKEKFNDPDGKNPVMKVLNAKDLRAQYPQSKLHHNQHKQKNADNGGIIYLYSPSLDTALAVIAGNQGTLKLNGSITGNPAAPRYHYTYSTPHTGYNNPLMLKKKNGAPTEEFKVAATALVVSPEVINYADIAPIEPKGQALNSPSVLEFVGAPPDVAHVDNDLSKRAVGAKASTTYPFVPEYIGTTTLRLGFQNPKYAKYEDGKYKFHVRLPGPHALGAPLITAKVMPWKPEHIIAHNRMEGLPDNAKPGGFMDATFAGVVVPTTIHVNGRTMMAGIQILLPPQYGKYHPENPGDHEAIIHIIPEIRENGKIVELPKGDEEFVFGGDHPMGVRETARRITLNPEQFIGWFPPEVLRGFRAMAKKLESAAWPIIAEKKGRDDRMTIIGEPTYDWQKTSREDVYRNMPVYDAEVRKKIKQRFLRFTNGIDDPKLEAEALDKFEKENAGTFKLKPPPKMGEQEKAGEQEKIDGQKKNGPMRGKKAGMGSHKLQDAIAAAIETHAADLPLKDQKALAKQLDEAITLLKTFDPPRLVQRLRERTDVVSYNALYNVVREVRKEMEPEKAQQTV